MGELITFRPAKGGGRSSAVPATHAGIAAKIVVFTGIWRERLEDAKSPAKRVRRVSGKRFKKGESALEGPPI